MEAWPPERLRIRTPRLELRIPTDHELVDLGKRSHGRILEPGQEHYFQTGWWRAKQPDYTYNLIRHNAEMKATWAISRWTLYLVPFLEGQGIGQISLRAFSFPRNRSLNTGSWLLPEFRGQGFAREMRAGLLWFGFETLDAYAFTTAARHDNAASIKTTLSLGYKPDRESVDRRHFRIAREKWLDDTPTEVHGFGRCSSFFLKSCAVT